MLEVKGVAGPKELECDQMNQLCVLWAVLKEVYEYFWFWYIIYYQAVVDTLYYFIFKYLSVDTTLLRTAL